MTDHRDILAMVREDDIRHDPWGTALAWWFAIADLMVEWAPPYPPADWQFRQAMGGADTEAWGYRELSPMLERGEITTHDLLRAGNILARYTRVCELAGVSY